MTATITFNDEFEWRSYAILATATHTIVSVSKDSRLALFHYRILKSLRSLTGNMRDLLDLFHTPQAIPCLEAATPEQLVDMVDTINDIHEKITRTIARIHSTKLGYWRSLYCPVLEKLETYNHEISCHAQAFTQSDSSILLLALRRNLMNRKQA